ncbi:archease [Candidatus Woesearchaeota archaeon]|nr:archease [Candidatus Woesearchaeota archaeon]
MKRYEYLPHTADVRFRAYGKTMEEAFANAAAAMVNVMVDTAKVKAKTTKKIAAEGSDLPSLLQSFLEQFVILLDTDNFFLSSIKEMKISNCSGKYSLTAIAAGDEAKNYETLGPLVKACTYNSMLVRQEGKKWVAQVVVDI